MRVVDAPVFVEPEGATDWVQLNIGLVAEGSLRDAASPLFNALHEWIAVVRSRGSLECWFVRKQPGLRVRLRGSVLDVKARASLERMLDALAGTEPVEFWGWATYEPEVERLGGPRVLEGIHRWLSQGAELWLEWERLHRTGRSRLGAELMALSLYHPLLLRALGAPEEAWAVWRSLRTIYDRASEPSPDSAAPSWSMLMRLASVDERALLVQGAGAVEELAQVLTLAHDRGWLCGGRRALLATLASFHFNLWCLRPEQVARLCRCMGPALAPEEPVAVMEGRA